VNNPPNVINSHNPLSNDRVEDYLDHVCTPLVGLVPYRVRNKLRMEVEDHLCALIAEFSERGLAPIDALDAAMKEHGEPWRIGQAYANAWSRGSSDNCPNRFVAPYILHGLAWVGMASVPTLLFVEQYCLVRGSVTIELLGAVAVLAPFVAGCLTGLTAPARPVLAVSCAMMVHVLVAFAAGCLMLPEVGCMRFAVFQLLFWIPSACGSAWTTAYFRLLNRRQKFLRRVLTRAV
jgi:hypothetical protein